MTYGFAWGAKRHLAPCSFSGMIDTYPFSHGALAFSVDGVWLGGRRREAADLTLRAEMMGT